MDKILGVEVGRIFEIYAGHQVISVGSQTLSLIGDDFGPLYWELRSPNGSHRGDLSEVTSVKYHD